MVARDRVTNALEAERIETDERDGEAGPEFLLELRQHALLRDHQDTTPAAALVHDCQVLTESLYPEVFDTVVDTIFTPTRTIEVSNPHKPEGGIVWDLLDPVMYDTIPPLQELRAMESGLPARG